MPLPARLHFSRVEDVLIQDVYPEQTKVFKINFYKNKWREVASGSIEHIWLGLVRTMSRSHLNTRMVIWALLRLAPLTSWGYLAVLDSRNSIPSRPPDTVRWLAQYSCIAVFIVHNNGYSASLFDYLAAPNYKFVVFLVLRRPGAWLEIFFRVGLPH